MKLLTDSQFKKLRSNETENRFRHMEGSKLRDYKPVAKLFTPWSGATWLFTELQSNGILFGLCYVGIGCPEYGYVSISELENMRGPWGLKVERDIHFKAEMTLSEYYEAAKAEGRIYA